MNSRVKALSLSARSYGDRALAALAHMFSFAPSKVIITDALITVALGVACAVFALFELNQFDFFRLCRGFDLWFDADSARHIANLTDRYSPFHYRSSLHPLWSLFFAAPIGGVSAIFGLPMSQATAIYVALQAFVVTSVVYLALRSFRLARIDAVLGLLLLLSTSAGIYWLGFPEWVAFGTATAVLSTIWLASPPQFKNRFTGTVQNFLSSTIVVTTWGLGGMASLLGTWPKLDWKSAFVHTRDAIVLIAVLSIVQYRFFPDAGGVLDIWDQTDEIATASSTFLDYLRTFFGHTLAAPAPALIEGVKTEMWFFRITSIQQEPIALTAMTIPIFGLWIVLWGLGVFTAVRDPSQRIVFYFVVGALGFFFVLHSLFGGESFLFAMEFATFMTFIALWGARWKFKWVVRAICAALIVLGFSYNYPMFQNAVAAHNAVDLSWTGNLGWVSDYTQNMVCN